MVILLNRNACAGKAETKWNRIQNAIRKTVGKYTLVESNDSAKILLLDELRKGEQKFIAAGGDGTINFLLNTLAQKLEPEQLRQIQVGAIGLGSSNDFHKPFNKVKLIDGIPCRFDFTNTVLHDLGKVNWIDEQKKGLCNYWINNASIGVTAEANCLFNHPHRFLLSLKSKTTNQAIVYTAVKTIFTYKNIWADVSCDQATPRTTEITNLGIVKNPNFSGSFCYDSPYTRNSGLFYVHTCEGMTIPQTLGALYNLSSGKFTGSKNTRSCKASAVNVKSSKHFAVEYDGEVIRTNQAEFSLIKNGVQLCA
ncbi:MAG: diacylglycerol kinase family protein [Ignavibacteria bacterium]|nr:diacylglycerol kinase family protein [Ignavibacteria bacterium]